MNVHLPLYSLQPHRTFLGPSRASCVVFLSLLMVQLLPFAEGEWEAQRCTAVSQTRRREPGVGPAPHVLPRRGVRWMTKSSQELENSFPLSSTTWAENVWRRRGPSAEGWVRPADTCASSRTRSLTDLSAKCVFLAGSWRTITFLWSSAGSC